MLPLRLAVGGRQIEIWDVAFLVGVAIGFLVLRATFEGRPRGLALRYLVTAYVAAVGAQLFAYLFDANTTVLPPPGVHPLAYYLNPLAGPKTLYGAIAFLPLGVALVASRGAGLPYGDALRRWTPATMTVLGVSRVGCLLQGCCYGIRSDRFGIPFAPRSPAHGHQVMEGLVARDRWSLPVIPTQALEAVALFAIAAWSLRRIRRNEGHVFEGAVVAYSLFRIAVEFVRDDPGRNALGPLSTSQWIGIAMLAAAAVASRGRVLQARQPSL
jgi:prolipoprotein diacylglyceryltransferase